MGQRVEIIRNKPKKQIADTSTLFTILLAFKQWNQLPTMRSTSSYILHMSFPRIVSSSFTKNFLHAKNNYTKNWCLPKYFCTMKICWPQIVKRATQRIHKSSSKFEQSKKGIPISVRYSYISSRKNQSLGQTQPTQ